MRLLFCGTPDYTVDYLELLSRRHTVAGVLTAPDAATGRGRKTRRPAPARWAESRGIPCFQPASLKDPAVCEEINGLNVELGAVVAYGRILPEKLFKQPPHGYINLHFSLLPAFRGASPIESALLCGVKQSGVSVQKIVRELDAGDLLLSREVAVAADDHFPELFDKLHRAGLELLPEAVDRIARGEAVYTPQNEQQALHCGKISRCERDADWSVPAAELTNRIRAFCGHRTVRSRCNGEEVLLHRAAAGAGNGTPGEVLTADKSGLTVACGTGSVNLLVLQRQNRKPIDYKSFLNGFKLQPGDKFE